MRAQYLALFLACFSILGANGVAAQQGQPTVLGLWQQVDPATGKSESWFLFFENNGVYEGAIAKMFITPGDDPNPICTRCQGEQKNSPMLGLTIVKQMHRNGLKYENGTILDPRDGNVYNALMELSPDGQKLTVRGYLGIALFEVWPCTSGLSTVFVALGSLRTTPCCSIGAMSIMMMSSTSMTSTSGVTLISDLTPPWAPPRSIAIQNSPNAIGFEMGSRATP